MNPPPKPNNNILASTCSTCYMSVTLLGASCSWIHLILTQPKERRCCHLHFTGDKAQAQRSLSKLPKVTQLASDRATCRPGPPYLTTTFCCLLEWNLICGYVPIKLLFVLFFQKQALGCFGPGGIVCWRLVLVDWACPFWRCKSGQCNSGCSWRSWGSA